MDVLEPFQSVKRQNLNISANSAVHWYDFTCPFCYIAQARNRWLRNRGVTLIELPFQAHPKVPSAGLTMGTRQGPMYERLEEKARLANLPLRYQTVSRLPSTWTVIFSKTPGQDGTLIDERMTIPFGAAGKTFLGLIWKPPAAERASNLNRLKQLFENGSDYGSIPLRTGNVCPSANNLMLRVLRKQQRQRIYGGSFT